MAYVAVYNKTNEPVRVDVSGATIAPHSYGIANEQSIYFVQAVTRRHLEVVVEAVNSDAQAALDAAAAATASPPAEDPNVPERPVVAPSRRSYARVVHGTDASYPRPDADHVDWEGQVVPTNMEAGDRYDEVAAT